MLCEGPIKRIKRQATDWEKIFANHVFDKRLVSTINKQLSKPNKKTFQLDSGHRHEQTEEDIRMANKHMRKYLMILVIREMQIKTSGRYHHTLIIMAKTKNCDSIKRRQECRETGSLRHCW